MKKNKHIIKTFNDLVDVIDVVDDGTFDNFCVDMLEWMAFTRMFIKEMRQKLGEQVIGKKASELMNCYFTWIDDGETGIKSFEIAQNGKTKRIKL